MLSKICSELQRFHSEVIDVREKCHSIGVKVHDKYLDEHHLEHKYFYGELLEKDTLQRVQHAPQIVKDRLFLKIRERKLEEHKKLFAVKEKIIAADVKVVYW